MKPVQLFLPSAMLFACCSSYPVLASVRGVPASDVRLLRPVQIASRGISLQNALALFAKETEVPMHADGVHAGFQNILYARRLPLRNMMIALAWANRMTWQKQGTGYLLTQTPTQKAVEQAAVAQVRRKHLMFKQMRIASVEQAAAVALAKNQTKEPVWQILEDMDDQTKQALYTDCIQNPEAFRVGGGAALYRNYLFGMERFSHLPQNLQKMIPAYMTAMRHEYKTSSFHATLPEYISAQQAHNNFYGLYAYSGQISLLIVPPAENHLFFTLPLVSRAYLPGYDMNGNNTDPRVVKLLPKDHFDQMEPLPARLLQPSLHFTTSQYLPDLMQQFYTTTGHAVICPRYVNSLTTLAQGLLTYHNKFTLPDAIQEVDRAFGYHSAWFGSMLVSRTTDPGRNIYNEPPAGLLRRMDAFALNKGPMSLTDIRQLAELSHKQWKNLWWHAIPEEDFHVDGYELTTNWRFAFMRLFGSLAPLQLAAAESARGLPASSLNTAQRLQLILAVDMGPRPAHPLPPHPGMQPGLHVRLVGTAQHVKFIHFIVAYPYLGRLRVTRWTFAAKLTTAPNMKWWH